MLLTAGRTGTKITKNTVLLEKFVFMFTKMLQFNHGFCAIFKLFLLKDLQK